MNFLKNIALLAVVLILSYFTAHWFGAWYDKFSPLHDSSIFPMNTYQLQLIVGSLFGYLFFTILIFQLFGYGNRNKWTLWLLLPPFLFFGSGDIRHLYLPIILGLVALGLATLINKLLLKPKTPQNQ